MTPERSSCSPSVPPDPQVCLPLGQRGSCSSNVPLGAVDRHAVVLVPATVGISRHEAAMAASTVDLTHVQGYLAHFPLGAHIQLPLEREQDWVRPAPSTDFSALEGILPPWRPLKGHANCNQSSCLLYQLSGWSQGHRVDGTAHPLRIQ